MSTNTTGKKYLFSLKGINPENVDRRYDINITSNIEKDDDVSEHKITKISELASCKSEPETVTFLDETKKKHSCMVSMVDYRRKKDFYDVYKYDHYCFWGKHEIPSDVVAIGCPLVYTPPQAVKNYYSEISKDNYTIKENITIKRFQQLKKEKREHIEVFERNFYYSDGIFCSFSCAAKFADEMVKQQNPIYSQSNELLLQIYNGIYPDKIAKIRRAPHWRKLKRFGGNLDINEFRNNSNKLEYIYCGSIVPEYVPKFVAVGSLYEENLRI